MKMRNFPNKYESAIILFALAAIVAFAVLDRPSPSSSFSWISSHPLSSSRSYVLMEQLFKIYVYKEGEPPIFHYGPCKGIYSREGVFINSLEMSKRFHTRSPDEAHVYFLPFSIVMIIQNLLHPHTRVLGRIIGDYVLTISHKYPFWNRSSGADHFMLSCHDKGPKATRNVKELYDTSIRVLSNANTTEHFNPKEDASLPEINLKTGKATGLVGGYPPWSRTILAFFAGGLHGRIRRTLFLHRRDKRDKDVPVYQKLPRGFSCQEAMKKSKYCLCPSGYEVASPRIAEAIYAECVNSCDNCSTICSSFQ